jgi:hypothetical protein
VKSCQNEKGTGFGGEISMRCKEERSSHFGERLGVTLVAGRAHMSVMKGSETWCQ